MAVKLIELDDGTLVEAEVRPAGNDAIAGNLADTIKNKLDSIGPLLTRVCRSVATAAWSDLNHDILVDHAEVELGLSFESEGNLYIAKGKAGANISVKLTLKPAPPADKAPGV